MKKDFKEIYKFPLVLHGDGTIKSANDDLVMIADEDVDIDDIWQLMDIINEDSDLRVNDDVRYSSEYSHGEILIDDLVFFKVYSVIPDMHGLTPQEALEMRDDFGKYIVRQLNDIIKIEVIPNTKH